MATLHTALDYVRLTRPSNAAAVTLGYSVGYFFDSHAVWSLRFVAGLVVGLLVHSLVTVENDIQDFAIDRANGRSSALQNRAISPAQARRLVWALAVAALAVSLAVPSQLTNLGFLAVFLALAWAYNNRPFQLSRKPLASIAVLGLCYGLVPLVYGFALSGNAVHRSFIWLVVLWVIARVSISIMKDYKDSRGDRQFKKDTFYLHFGPAATAAISFSCSLLGYAGVIILLLITKVGPVVFDLALGLATLLAVRNLWLRSEVLYTRSEKRLSQIFNRSFYYHNQFEAAVLLCLLLSSK